jgi:hypothetical protein
LLFVHVGSLTMHGVRSKPLASIEDATFSWAKLLSSSKCTEMLFVLRSPRDHALKVDQAMLDLIVVLKADCPEIQ